MISTTETLGTRRRLLRVRGAVQGVGFRPFVHRLALAQGLSGWVRNDAAGVLIGLQGTEQQLEGLVRSLFTEAPPAARVEEVEEEHEPSSAPDLLFWSTEDGAGFRILESPAAEPGIRTAVPADLAVCEECRSELLDPADRRHAYAFINCTQCGPRYSLIDALPYDRPRTTMARFRMCVACETEYGNPSSRRYHAEPNACPECGPRLTLLDARGTSLACDRQALEQAAGKIAEGGIVAVKGLGGFHLFCDAGNESAVKGLRARKHRDEKPFAVMFPDMESARREVELGEAAEQALRSPAAPVVLAARRHDSTLPAQLAPGNHWLGVLLPYTPLHVLLLRILARPLVATSANLAEEPLCTNDAEVLALPGGVADLLLTHDREILRPVDDSVLRLDQDGIPVLLRRARGHAPSPLRLPGRLSSPLLCAGAQMKASVAIASEDKVVLSPHIGDLGNMATQQAYERSIRMLAQLCGDRFEHIACDKHPGYDSTRLAARSGLPLFLVQHHLAHLLACLLEHRREADGVLGVIWDGTGLGEDGSIWGGEFLLAKAGRVARFAHLRRFSLPGSDAVSRDARRSAFALLHENSPSEALERARGLGLSESEASTLSGMIRCGLNSPRCSSMGRLFDAAGLLLGVGARNAYEGQLPLGVESLALACRENPRPLPFHVREATEGGCLELDWQESLACLGRSERSGPERALAFHLGLAESIVAVARRAGVGTVALSGGCFQNILLLDLARTALRREGFDVLSHRLLPPGDGAIAAGQALASFWGLGSVDMPS